MIAIILKVFCTQKICFKFLREDAEAFDLSALLRPAIVVPESKRVDRMLKEFRSERFHMAIVVDEFGAVSGLGDHRGRISNKLLVILKTNLMRKMSPIFVSFLVILMRCVR